MSTAKKTKERVADKILHGLRDLVETLEHGIPLAQRYRVTARPRIDVPQTNYDADLVAATRALLGIDAITFAKLLGVTASTVQAWERGTRTPAEIACRFMDEIRHNPDYWRERLRQLGAVPLPL